MSIPLGYYLLRQRKILVPSGFGFWLLFLAVILIGFLVLWTPVPGLVAESGIARILPWAYRALWFGAVTVVLLFIGNTSEKQFPRKWLIFLMGWLFILTVIGGYAGQFLWQYEFPSFLEMILPRSLRSNVFLNSLIHPGLAQIQDILGYPDPRPKAPFEYANSWGANFGLLLPFYLMTYRYTRHAGHRIAFVLVLLAAIPPVIFSLNRGLWAGLGVMALVIVVRMAITGRWFAVVGAGATAIVLYIGLLVTPLWETIQTRLENPHSNEGRSNLAGITMETVLQYSPLIGFGATRSRQGNFFSIASGATADCHQCSPPQLGTQGSFWFLIFCTGFLGAGLFCAFMLRRTVPVITRSDSWATPLLYPVVFFFCVLPVYDLIGSPLMILMITLGLVWRYEQEKKTQLVAAQLATAEAVP